MGQQAFGQLFNTFHTNQKANQYKLTSITVNSHNQKNCKSMNERNFTILDNSFFTANHFSNFYAVARDFCQEFQKNDTLCTVHTLLCQLKGNTKQYEAGKEMKR